jgi:hypothetical protein
LELFVLWRDAVQFGGVMLKLGKGDFMEKVKHSVKSPKCVGLRVFWGVFFLGAAGLILLTSFGVIRLGVNIGTMVGLVAMAAVALAFLIKQFWMGAFMVIAAGLMVASSSGMIMDFSGQQRGMIFVAAALVGVAFHIMFHKKWHHHGEEGWKTDKSAGNDVTVRFAGVNKHIVDKEFMGATFRCNFGAIKANFDGAKVKGEKATIWIENHFSGVELQLPKNWAVNNQMDMMMGEVEEKNQPTITVDSPQIEMVGTLKCGGVTITYV